MSGTIYKIIDIFWRLEDAGVPADLDPPLIWNTRSKSASGYGPPSADLDPPTKLNENIILNVLVNMDDTLCFNAY